MRILVIGGGIGGLTLALMLDARGIACDVFEAVPRMRELGVGINLLPRVVSELAELGLLARLDRISVRTRELIYATRLGQEVWREARGVDAGYESPQLSTHRGRLHGVLRDAVIERLGRGAVRTGHAFTAFVAGGASVEARFEREPGHGAATATGDALVGCDGIHSAVRRQLYPDDGGLKWNGVMMWRGATLTKGFLDGRTMVISGGLDLKLVTYPIADGIEPGLQLVNWAICRRSGDGSAPPPRREDWSRRGSLDDVIPLARQFRTPYVDPVELAMAAPVVYEYPMVDRDPLPRWTHGRVTLLGDAAHPMYPVGSNGASQAILDARCLADCIATGDGIERALAAYEAERLPKTAEVVRVNREGGPEGVIDEVERRAPDGFANVDDVLSHAEREGIVKGYARLAGFAK